MSAMKMVKRTTVGSLALAVCLAGGGVALAGSASAASFGFSRAAAGTDRYHSAVLASKAAFPDGDTSAKAVVIVNGDRPVDGLTATSLAGQMNAVVLYSGKDGVNDATREEIKRLGVKTIVMVGGTSVLSQSMQDAIKGDGYSVTRVGGADRYETAAQVAKALVDAGATPTTAFVASGADANLVDSTTAAPVAYASRQPVLLTKPNEVPSATAASLKSLGVKNVLVLGGSTAVGDSVYSQLGGTKRVAGADRAETATQLADWAKDSAGFSRSDVALVGGDGSVTDSLAAAAFLGKKKVNLYYAGYAATDAYLMAHASDLTGQGYVFGGKSAVSDDAINKITTTVATAASAGSSASKSNSVTVPTVLSGIIDGANTLTVTLSGPVTIQNASSSITSSSSALVSQFSWNPGDGSSAASPTGVTVSGNTATLTFGAGVLKSWKPSDTITYTPSNLYTVTDGNLVGSTGKPVLPQVLSTIADGFAATPTITAPVPSTSYVNAASSPSNAVPVSGVAEPGATVTVTGGSTSPVTAVANGSGVYSVNVSLTTEASFTLSATQADTSGNLSATPVTKTVVRDVTAPVIASAVLASGTDTKIVLTYTEAQSFASATPLVGDYSVSNTLSGGGASNTLNVSSVLVSASDKTVTLNLGAAPSNASDVQKVTYTPNSGDTTKRVQDAAGNFAGTLTNQSVTH